MPQKPFPRHTASPLPVPQPPQALPKAPLLHSSPASQFLTVSSLLPQSLCTCRFCCQKPSSASSFPSHLSDPTQYLFSTGKQRSCLSKSDPRLLYVLIAHMLLLYCPESCGCFCHFVMFSKIFHLHVHTRVHTHTPTPSHTQQASFQKGPAGPCSPLSLQHLAGV